MKHEKSKEPGSIATLARWIKSVDSAAIPSRAIEQAKLIVLDTIGCGVLGRGEETSHALLALAAELGGAETCTIIGEKRRSSPLHAVLTNGCLVRVLDLNDYIGGGSSGGPEIGGHPSDNVPVALAIGEARGCSGSDVLAAIVIGYEVFGRLKRLMNPVGVWDEVSISGIVAPAIAGRLMGLDETTLAHALALGATRAATPAIVRGGHISAAKSIANALVAQAGVQGALLAAHGVTGPLAVLDAPRGVRELFAQGDAIATLSAPMPDDPYIMRSSVKTYPCLATGQSAVAAALKLHAMIGGHVDRLTKIEVSMSDYPIVKRQQQDPARIKPQSREAADHSFNFLTAVTLIDGRFGLEQYDNVRWLDPKVIALMDRLELTNDPSWADRAQGSYPCGLRAIDRDGRELVADVPYPPGFARDGLTAAEVISKFHAITASHLSETARERIVAAAQTLDRAASLDSLMAELRFG